MGPRLRVENLNVSYGSVHAVRGVNIEIQGAECVAIIGTNGAGKTPLLRGIAGLAPARSDGIWLDDRRIDGLPPEHRAQLGLGSVLQGRHVFPGLSVRDNLELGQIGTRRGNLAGGLERVHQIFPDLLSRANQAAGSLSGGQQQFLAIARALMAEPAVLLLDEPSLGLAPRLIDKLAEVLVTLVEANTPIVLVEQRLDLVQRTALTVHMLSHGEIVVSTTTQDADLVAKAHDVYMGLIERTA